MKRMSGVKSYRFTLTDDEFGNLDKALYKAEKDAFDRGDLQAILVLNDLQKELGMTPWLEDNVINEIRHSVNIS